jgi:hypothetical protein
MSRVCRMGRVRVRRGRAAVKIVTRIAPRAHGVADGHCHVIKMESRGRNFDWFRGTGLGRRGRTQEMARELVIVGGWRGEGMKDDG